MAKSFFSMENPRETLDRIIRGVSNLYEKEILKQYGKFPVTYSIPDVYPELLELEKNYSIIREEAAKILELRSSLPKYHELDPAQAFIADGVEKDKNWRIFMINFLGDKNGKCQELCPRTSALIDKLPNLFCAFFSVLDPGKSIPAHTAGNRTYLRYHLGLIVPKENPPTIRVKDVFHTWTEGGTFFFDDSWDHEVINNSTEPRVILIVDVLRPMPIQYQPIILMHKLGAKLTYGRMLMSKIKHF